MKKQTWLFITFLALSGTLQAQREDFSSCAGAFLGKKLVVNEYTTTGTCVMAATATGELTLRPVFFTEGEDLKRGDKIPFKVAIRNGSTKTLLLWSEKTYRELDIQKVLKDCKKGDSVVLLTLDRQWSVPHPEILVE